MSRFIPTDNSKAFVNLANVSMVDRNVIITRDQGEVVLSEGDVHKFNELLGEYHPNTQQGIFVLEELESHPGHYLKLRVIGWIRCPKRQMVPVLVHGQWMQLSMLNRPDFAVLDEQAGVVYTTRIDDREDEIIPLKVWEEHSGLQPF